MRPSQTLFVHGWGMAPSMWDGVRARIAEPGIAVDLGYAGTPSLPRGQDRVVGIGHSFGLIWLLHRMPERLERLIAINGFARFPAAPRVLARMQGQFARDPRRTLDAFRARCLLPPWVGPCDDAKLAEDLDALASWDQRPTLNRLAIPFVSLAAADDPIVPTGSAAARPGTPPCICPAGGHILPLSRPDWCADKLRAALA